MEEDTKTIEEEAAKDAAFLADLLRILAAQDPFTRNGQVVINTNKEEALTLIEKISSALHCIGVEE